MLKSFGTLYQTNTKGKNKMNKRQILASLNKIANTLDNNGLHQESNHVAKIMKRLSQNELPIENSNPREVSKNLSSIASLANTISVNLNSGAGDKSQMIDSMKTLIDMATRTLPMLENTPSSPTRPNRPRINTLK